MNTKGFALPVTPHAGRVIVVDDDPVVLEVAASMLEQAGFDTQRAATAMQCLALMQAAQVDVVLTDICMEGMDGFALIVELHTLYPHARVVVMTGHDSYEMVRATLTSGAYDYLCKPLGDPIALAGCISRAVDSSRLTQQNVQLMAELKQVNARLHRANARLTGMNRHLEQLAHTDELTGLHNRRYADRYLEREVARYQRYGEQLTVGLIDIDHFKRFNDAHGHAGGDLALQSVARALSDGIRLTDLVGRYGGEEFVLILPATLAEDACVLAERLRQAIADTGMTEALSPGELTISIGLVDTAGLTDPVSSERLLEAADEALYAAKARGRNCVVRHGGATTSGSKAA